MIQRTQDGKYFFNGKEITAKKYEEIVEIIKNKPIREGYEYYLRDDLTWEERKIPAPDHDPEIDDAELLNILMGGAE